MEWSKTYIADRVLHWLSALLLLFMLMNLSSQLHNVDWQIKGQLEHRQDAVELHATVGVVLLGLTLLRLVFGQVFRQKIPRITPRSTQHAWFIKSTHLALYFCIAGLVGSGLAMFANYEIPLNLLGVDFSPSKQDFYQVFPQIQQAHHLLKSALWWLIGIHFVGILYAKR